MGNNVCEKKATIKIPKKLFLFFLLIFSRKLSKICRILKQFIGEINPNPFPHSPLLLFFFFKNCFLRGVVKLNEVRFSACTECCRVSPLQRNSRHSSWSVNSDASERRQNCHVMTRFSRPNFVTPNTRRSTEHFFVDHRERLTPPAIMRTQLGVLLTPPWCMMYTEGFRKGFLATNWVPH